MFSDELKIPRDRVAVLIGTKGETKKQLQKKLNIWIEVNKDGEVILNGEDSLAIFIAVPVIKAIGRGFTPEKSLKLTNENFILEILNIQDYTGKSKTKFTRIKARLIGTGGKARGIIERLANVDVCIYGKTVSILGRVEDVLVARGAIEKLLKGAPHGNVYKFIELQK